MAKKLKKKRKWVLRASLISAIRRLFSISPVKKLVLENAKVPHKATKKDGSASKAKRVKYKCCTCNKLFDYKEIQVDHEEPVIDIGGWKDWNTYVERMFVGIDFFDEENITKEMRQNILSKLTVKCIPCHNEKSAVENKARKRVKKRTKKTDSEAK
jgi:5-methylcytosine-specific restriction endonuclease McrA